MQQNLFWLNIFKAEMCMSHSQSVIHTYEVISTHVKGQVVFSLLLKVCISYCDTDDSQSNNSLIHFLQKHSLVAVFLMQNDLLLT